MPKGFRFFTPLLFLVSPVLAQMPETIDTASVSKIKEEGMKDSHVMEMLSSIADVY